MNARALAALLALLAALLVLAAWFLWPAASPPPAVIGATRTPTPAPATPAPEAAAAPTHAAGAYRLAGVAAGNDFQVAVFESPDGQTEMYRVGDTIPGLGKLVRVEERRAVVTGEHGDVDFTIRPAPTPSPDLRSPTARSAATIALRSPSPAPARTAAGSSPSAGPGRSAS